MDDLEKRVIFTEGTAAEVIKALSTLPGDCKVYIGGGNLVALHVSADGKVCSLDEVEEFVHRFVTLIKDGNIATTKLMKKSMELNKKAKRTVDRDFAEDMISMRDHIVAMRNLDEEISKTSERNQIQLTDVKEELLAQKKECREFESDISFLFEEVQKKIR